MRSIYYAMILEFDAMVGAYIDAIEESTLTCFLVWCAVLCYAVLCFVGRGGLHPFHHVLAHTYVISVVEMA